MERILSGDDKIKRAEELYYRRKKGIPSSKLSRNLGDKKTYLGSKILLEILVIINFSIIIIGIQNKDYIFTENFLNDVQKYNINITQNIMEFIGVDTVEENEPSENFVEVQDLPIVENNPQEIVPNVEGEASSLNEMEENIGKIKELVSIEKPIRDGIVTSRFGTRESANKNVEGYHIGIDIGSPKGTSIYAATSGTVSLVSSVRKLSENM